MRSSRPRTQVRKRDESIVVDLTEPVRHDGPVASVTDVDQLVRLAKRYEAMILRLRGTAGAQDLFWVWDQGMLFTCGASAAQLTQALGRAETAEPAEPEAPARQRPARPARNA